MKKLKINSSIAYIFVILLAVSCSKSDKVFNEITDNVTRGAVLRQLDVMSNSVAINSDTGELESGQQFAVLVEYQDNEDGTLLSDMDVYVSFTDNTEDNGENSKSEVLVETISASAFSEGDRGLPQYSYSISADEMLSALGLSESQLGTGGDLFRVRFEINLSDGRSFTDTQNSGTLTGSYFSSPFNNRVNIVCGATVPTAGTWTIEATDSYGDGWNGASLAISIDGEAATLYEGPAESTDTYTFEVPTGATTISIKFNSGDWDEEISYSIVSANGNEVTASGPNPTAGVELLDYCKGGL